MSKRFFRGGRSKFTQGRGNAGIFIESREGGRRSFFRSEHDDRWEQKPGRHVQFKAGGRKPRMRGGLSHQNLQAIFGVDDGMGARPPGGGYQRSSMKGSRRGMKNRSAPNLLLTGNSFKSLIPGWFKIEVYKGKKYKKDFILGSITSSSAVPFVPYEYQEEGQNAVFYVRDRGAADAIRACDRRITTPDNFKLSLCVKATPPPIPNLNKEVKSLITQVMSARYNSNLKALDMSKFDQDDAFNKAGVYVPLSRFAVMSTALKVMEEHIMEMEALDLSSNRLTILDMLGDLKRASPNLKILHLTDNSIREMSQLEKLKGLPLLELKLTGNPVVKKFPNESDYVRCCGSLLKTPNPILFSFAITQLGASQLAQGSLNNADLVSQDDKDLPPPIGFDVEETQSIPVTRPSCFCSEEGKKLSIAFLENYFACYDADNREKLLTAYHNDALFSISVDFNPNAHSHKLSKYLDDNRNLLKSGKHEKLLQQGKFSVVSALSKLPKTLHDPQTFSVDVPFVLPSLMAIHVSGVFKDRDHQPPAIHSFSRSFCLVPDNGGFLILNDQLFVTTPTLTETKMAFQTPTPTPSQEVTLAPSIPTVLVGATGMLPLPGPSTSSLSRESLIDAFSQESGMKPEYAAKCLEDNDWNYAAAAKVFTAMNAQGGIPPDAFK
ncbi:unnamed protein product [Darwinula stevensoni]|uniref:Nuclear RNA export factor 1 n=1 Tax=Darwinula stevensoni TaxID=69355 RepID=A0A7R8X500_9CRUS|nr:unnamed protein product [Darwinula stevensoni]CAG0886612.1 unnamed protein product [Darwinula stevensoni]